MYACSMKNSKANANQYGNVGRTDVGVEATDGSPRGSTPPGPLSAVTLPPPYSPTVPSSRLLIPFTRVLTGQAV
jgi:hypothetical protein